MKKRILILVSAIIALVLLPVITFAENTNTITYDYGIANIRSETITNTNPDSYTSSGEIILSQPECPGFEFSGWYLEPDFRTEVTSIDTSADSDIVLYAKWYEMLYNITYVLETPGKDLTKDEITNLNPTSRLAGESTYLLTPDCNSEIYTFDGWYTDKNYENRITSIDAFTCNDVTVYAKWVYSTFSVHYDLGVATHSLYPVTNPNPESYVYNTEIIIEDASVNDPSYIFDGWYTDEFFTQKVTSVPAGTKGDIILYAKWQTVIYNVNYVLEDDSGIDGEKIFNSNPTQRAAFTVFSLSDPVSDDKTYAFDGWYTSPDYNIASKIFSIPSDLTEDITIYAKWKIAEYTIKYDFGYINTYICEIENNNPVTYRYGDNTTLEDVEADGFIFNGWCTDKALKNKVTEIPAESYGNITLYADFTEKTYSISYVLNCKEVTASQVINKNIGIRTTTQQVSLDDPETINIEYQFDGWYLDSDYTQKVKNIKAYTTGNITLYAKWVKIIVYLPCWGDATLSEQLSAADARMILRYSAGLETGFSELQLRVSDINNDNEVNATDARLALRLSSGLEDEKSLKKQYSLPDIIVADGEIVFK